MTATSTHTLVDYEKDVPVNISTLSAEEKKELINADAVSILSSTTLGAQELSFVPAKSLYINTKGIPTLRLPLPPKELETSILDGEGNIAYLSTRGQRSSGNCTLTNSDGKPLIKTEYFFGPTKDPKLSVELGDGKTQEITTVSKWTSRNHTFQLSDGRTLNWSYKKEKGFGSNGSKGTALVLTVNDKRIAALIRNNETRTPGSKSCSAGNGGELVLGDSIAREGIDEYLVVATVLLMLKKEIDRRRTVQMMMIMAAVSGGS